jgi:hypothetical protein
MKLANIFGFAFIILVLAGLVSLPLANQQANPPNTNVADSTTARHGDSNNSTQPAQLSYEDAATIVVAARALRSWHPSVLEPPSDYDVTGTLVFLGYYGCKDQTYTEDVITCQDSISKQEIQYVRMLIIAPFLLEDEYALGIR